MDEVIRRNGGKVPKEFQVRRARDDYDSDAESVTSATSSGVSSRRVETGKKPFSVEEWVEDTFKTTTNAFGITRIPYNDVVFVANYLEYSKLEASLEQPVRIK